MNVLPAERSSHFAQTVRGVDSSPLIEVRTMRTRVRSVALVCGSTTKRPPPRGRSRSSTKISGVMLHPTLTSLAMPSGSPAVYSPLPSASQNTTNVFRPSRTWPDSALETTKFQPRSCGTYLLCHVTLTYDSAVSIQT